MDETTICHECSLPTDDGLEYRGRPCHILCMERAQRARMAALPERVVARSARASEGHEGRDGRMTDRGEDN